jgi:hypothetical protein
LSTYLDSRLQQTETVARIKKGLIREKNPIGICAASYWMSVDDTNELLAPAPIQQEVKLEYIDIPKMHTFTNEEANLFMEQLAETDDMELFNRKVVRKIIEFKWPLAREYVIKVLMIPFLVFMLCYQLYMNFFYERRLLSTTDYVISYVLMVPMAAASIYFLIQEARNFRSAGI